MNLTYEGRKELKGKIDHAVRARIKKARSMDRTCAGCGGQLDTFRKGCEVCRNRKKDRAYRSRREVSE